ncbi:MAG: hypothetical protein E7436_00965 [Ruminococcaceae bacterium]|nr:hypothetical protein [Oscillospiraceae bacterium]
MKQGKYETKHASKGVRMRLIMTVVAMAILVSCVVGGSIAWLLATESVTNTFTYGDINITLKETDTGLDDDGDSTTNDYVMVPGETIAKDPVITVLKGSEDCWLFAKLTESENLDDFITYEVEDGWTQLLDNDGNAVDGVYYRLVTDVTEDFTANVLKNNEVQVLGTVTKAMLNELDDGDEDDGYPTLTVTAYAVQYSGFEVAEGGTQNAAAYLAWTTAVATENG